MFHHATADRILTVIGAWIVLASLFALLLARWMGRRKDAQFDTHVAEALDLLDEGDNEEQIAADCARLVDETTAVLWLSKVPVYPFLRPGGEES